MITVLEGADDKFLLQCDYKSELDQLNNFVGDCFPEAKFFEGKSGGKPTLLLERSFGIPDEFNSVATLSDLLISNKL